MPEKVLHCPSRFMVEPFVQPSVKEEHVRGLLPKGKSMVIVLVVVVSFVVALIVVV